MSYIAFCLFFYCDKNIISDQFSQNKFCYIYLKTLISYLQIIPSSTPVLNFSLHNSYNGSNTFIFHTVKVLFNKYITENKEIFISLKLRVWASVARALVVTES